MFGIERRSRIISLLNEKKSISVQEAAEEFSVTEETIRRDFKVLEGQGLLVRTHGGAVLSDETRTEASLEIRQSINIAGKDAIGREAAKLINNGDTIILDASTSSLFVARHIKDRKGLTVITNAEKVVLELSDCEDITIICTGGTLRHKSLSYVGRYAEKNLVNFHADKAFISCKGFSPDKGFTDSNEQESDIRRMMINCSKTVVYLCDHTKFDKVGYVSTAKLEDTHYLITDNSLPPEWLEILQQAGVKLYISQQ